MGPSGPRRPLGRRLRALGAALVVATCGTGVEAASGLAATLQEVLVDPPIASPSSGLPGEPEVVFDYQRFVPAASDAPAAASAAAPPAQGARLGLPRPPPWPHGYSAPLDDENDWLRKWLASLEAHIPTTSVVEAGFNFTIKEGVCRHFEVKDVWSSRTADPGFNLGVTGLHVFCQLAWEAHSTLIPVLGSSGTVIAEVDDSSAGGPMKIVADDGNPPLPKAIKAYDCKAVIKVTSLTFSGSVLSGALELLSGFIKSLLNSQLKTIVCSNVDALINDKGSEFMQNTSRVIRAFLATGPVSPTKPWPLPEPHSDIVSFPQNSGVRVLDLLINGALGNSSSPFSLNVLTTLLLGKDGRLSVDGMGLLPLSTVVDLAGMGSLNISLRNLTVEGLNSFSRLALDLPDPQGLGLGMGLEKLKVNATVKLLVTPNGTGPLHGQPLTETFTIALGISDFGTSGGIFLALNSSKLGCYSIDQLPHMGCLAAGIPEVMVTKAALGATALQSLLQPVSGSSLEHHLDELINLVVGGLVSQFGAAMGAVADHAMKVTLRDMVNKKLDRELAFAPSCPAPLPTYSSVWLHDTMDVLGVVFFALAVLVAVVSKLRRRQKQNSQRTLSALEIGAPFSLQPEQASPQQTPQGSFVSAADRPSASPGHSQVHPVVRLRVPSTSQPSRDWDCLAFHPRTSPSLRWSLPLLLAVNIALFVGSNSIPGTNIRISLLANGEDVATFPPMKQYSLISSIKEMYESKVYALAALIVLFSGCWPYAKLLLMYACWFAPTRILSVAGRQKVLNFLDAYGKWSLVDMFVMVIMMVAFKFDLSDSSMPVPLIGDLFSSVGASFEFKVYAEPTLAFHVFVIGTVSSLILGHTMAGCHRWAHQLCEYGVAREGAGGVSRLCNKLRPGGLQGQVFVYGPAVTLALSGLLVLLGILLDTFNFTFMGLSGLLLGEDGRVRPFSVASLALAVPESNPDPNSVSMRFLQFTFIVFTMVFGIVYPIFLIVLWCAPLPDKVQRRMLVSSQVMNAWNSLDVFVVSILASVLEIERFALAVLGDKCDPINHALEKFPSIVEHMHGEPTCFDVRTFLRSGYFLLAAAAIIEHIAGGVVLARCSKAFCTASGTPGSTPSTTAAGSRRPSGGSNEP